jgi:hypothetical protein
MLASAIITKFEEYVDDATELSSSQELDLLQKVYNKVWMDRPWEFAKKPASGSFALTAPHIALPADFAHFLENNQTTDNSISIDNNAAPKVIFITSNYTPVQIVNWSDRRQYRNKTGFAYLDLPNNGITFTYTPTAIDTYEFDYKTIADTLTKDSTPAFPARFHDMLYHGMAVDDDIILRFPKAQSYAQENQAKYDSYLRDMASWNAALILN